MPDIYPMFIEPTINWFFRGSLGSLHKIMRFDTIKHVAKNTINKHDTHLEAMGAELGNKRIAH